MKTQWWLRKQWLPALLFASIPLVFLAAITWFRFGSAGPDADRARAETVASFQILRAVAAVDQAVQDAERGQRGFLLTIGRESYLEPYLDGKARLPKLMADLQRALHDSPNQQDRLLSLQAGVTTKMNELESTIVAFRTGGLDGALALVLTDLGRNAMDAMHADLAALVDTETTRLASRQREAAVAERRVDATFLIGSLTAAVALLFGGALLAGAYRRVAISELMLQSTLDSVREGVAAFDGGGRLRAWNTPFARLLDLTPAALQRGQALVIDGSTSQMATEIVGRIGALDATSRRTGRPTLVSYQGRAGQSLELFHNRVADGYVTTVLDVSNQRQAEEELRQAQKLESVGQMTG